MNALEWALLIALSLLWGGSFFFNAVAVAELPPFTVATGRVVGGALILLCVTRAMGLRLPRDPGIWAALLVMGMLNNAIPFSLIVWGQTQIASGVASILNATTPLFTVLVAHWLTGDERLSAPRLFGVLMGLAGVATLVGGAALDTEGSGVWGPLACLGAALSYAFAGIFGRRFARLGVQPMVTATGQVVCSSLLLLPVAALVEDPWTLALPSPSALAAVAGLAALATALAYIIFFRILATAGATNLSLATFLIPLTAISLGIMFLGEVLLVRHVFGMGLIGLGLAAIDGRPLRATRMVLARR